MWLVVVFFFVCNVKNTFFVLSLFCPLRKAPGLGPKHLEYFLIQVQFCFHFLFTVLLEDKMEIQYTYSPSKGSMARNTRGIKTRFLLFNVP